MKIFRTLLFPLLLQGLSALLVAEEFSASDLNRVYEHIHKKDSELKSRLILSATLTHREILAAICATVPGGEYSTHSTVATWRPKKGGVKTHKKYMGILKRSIESFETLMAMDREEFSSAAKILRVGDQFILQVRDKKNNTIISMGFEEKPFQIRWTKVVSEGGIDLSAQKVLSAEEQSALLKRIKFAGTLKPQDWREMKAHIAAWSKENPALLDASVELRRLVLDK